MGESAGRPKRLNPEAAPPSSHMKFDGRKASWFTDTDGDYEDRLFEEEKREPAEVEMDQESKYESEVDSKLECEDLEGEAEDRMKVVTLSKGGLDWQVTCAC